jgi:surfeit locus 1 family protein
VALSGAPMTVDDPQNLRYRSATVRGVFDHSQEVALQGQNWQGQPGVNLITPLVIKGSQQAVLVDRGWVPTEAAESNQWARFATTGPIEFTGLIKLSQPRLNAPPLTEPERAIFRVDIERLQRQIPYDLLPFFIVQAPTPGQTGLPYRTNTDIQLSNGPHLGYALQWFSFTLILGVGYIRYLHQNTQPIQLSEITAFSTMEA